MYNYLLYDGMFVPAATPTLYYNELYYTVASV